MQACPGRGSCDGYGTLTAEMAKSKPGTSTPDATLEQLIDKGDVEGTVAHLETLEPAERARHRNGLVRAYAAMHRFVTATAENGQPTVKQEWEVTGTADRRCATAIALIACGSARDAAAAVYEDDHLFAALERLRPAVLADLPDALLAIHPAWIAFVQRLIVARLVERPDSDAYAVGLISLPQRLGSRERLDVFFQQDPDLLSVLPRVFDVEGTSDTSLASIEKYSHHSVAWTALFLEWCAAGIYSRAFLLDRTLAALERGWIQHRSGWFSRFHDALAPTVVEMRPHLVRYLGLCSSRIPPTVTMALQSLKVLDDHQPIDAAALLSALEAPASSAVKGQVEFVLKMLVTTVRREPAVTGRAAGVARIALAHESKDVQAAALRLLKQWGVDADGAASLLDYLPGIAAANRPLLLELLGDAAEAASKTTLDANGSSRRFAVQALSPLDGQYRLHPIADCVALVEQIAHVFENDADVDAFEQALSALVALAPIPPSDLPRFSPVIKRAAKLRKPLPVELARLLAFVVGAKFGAGESFEHRSPAHQVLTKRVDDLIRLASRGKRLVPLATPTHRGGFIDALVLVERVKQHIEAGVSAGPLEEAMALLRLAPSGGALDQARALPDTLLTRALRYALGDDIGAGREPVFTAAARIRCRGFDDDTLLVEVGDNGPDGARAAQYSWEARTNHSTASGQTYQFPVVVVMAAPAPPTTPMELLSVWRHPQNPGELQFGRFWSFGGHDEGTIRYAATVLPTDVAAFCAEGARMIGSNLDWWEAQWQNKAYIEILLRPSTPVRGPAALLLALALMGKEPGQTAIAIDALAGSWREQRLDTAAVAHVLARLMATPLVKNPRLAKSLASALRLEPALEAFLFDLLGDILGRLNGAAPGDIAPLLEFLVELKARQMRELSAPTAASLNAMPLTGKARKLRTELAGHA